MGKRFLILLSIIVIILGYSVYQSYSMAQMFEGQIKTSSQSAISKLPDASFKYFNTKKEFKLASISKDKKVFVRFWATWCGPCEKEFPHLIELFRSYKNDKSMLFLLVSVNDEDKKVKKFLTKFKLDYENVLILEDNDNTYQSYFGTFKLPETYYFDQSKVLKKKFTGPQNWSESIFINFFKNSN